MSEDSDPLQRLEEILSFHPSISAFFRGRPLGGPPVAASGLSTQCPAFNSWGGSDYMTADGSRDIRDQCGDMEGRFRSDFTLYGHKKVI